MYFQPRIKDDLDRKLENRIRELAGLPPIERPKNDRFATPAMPTDEPFKKSV